MKYVSLLASALFALCTSAFAQTQLITNGGFESGTNGWTILGVGDSVVNDPSSSHSGSSHLSFVVNNASSQLQEAFQAFTVPSNAVSVYLTFFYNINTAEPASET